MTAPEFTTRDGVTYLLVPLPEVERLGSGWWVEDGEHYTADSYSSASLAERMSDGDVAAAAVLHARQAERPDHPTPETTVTDTPASTEAPLTIAQQARRVARAAAQRAEDRGFDRPSMVGFEVVDAITQAGLLRATAPDPAPRVLVDESDLRALAQRWESMADEHDEWADRYSADRNVGKVLARAGSLRACATDLRAALSAASPGGEQ